jgi:hypothetical protein
VAALKSSRKSSTSAPAAWEFAAYLSQIFYTQQIDVSVPANRESEASLDNASSDAGAGAGTFSANPVRIDTKPIANPSADMSLREKPRKASADDVWALDEDAVKRTHRKARVNNLDLKYRDIQTYASQELLRLESSTNLRDATQWLCDAVKTSAGRESFIAELNQFRSRKVSIYWHPCLMRLLSVLACLALACR